MADISNQLEGATEGLDRFIDSLDEISIRLGSNAALETKLARAKQKEVRIDVNIMKQKKFQLRNLTDVNKIFKDLSKSTKDFAKSMAKGGLSKGMTMLKGAAKAGIVGALIIGIKTIIDGMLKVDKSMAQLVKATGRARIGLEGMKQAIVDAESGMGMLGVSLDVATKEAANLSQQFGIIDKVTGAAVQTSLKLQMAYGLSQESAGQLLVTMERIGKSTEEFVGNLAVKAVKAGVNVSLVMRDIASQAQQYAMYNERAQQAMENMAIQAARTGGSLADIGAISDAYSTVEGIAENVGRVGTFFGQEVAAKLGDPKQLFMMAELGLWSDLQKIHDKAYKNEFKLIKNEQGLMKISHDLTREQVKIMQAQTGESILVLQNRILENDELERMGKLEGMSLEKQRQYLDIQKALLAKSNQVRKAQASGEKVTDKVPWERIHKIHELKKDDLAIIEKEIKKRAEEALQARKMNEIIKQSQTIVERFKNIFSGIWGEFTTQMSIAFGMDDRGEDSAMGKLEALATDIKAKLGLADLAKDIASGGGGLKGFMSAMESRLKPFFAMAGGWLMDALSTALEGYDFSMVRWAAGGSFMEKKGPAMGSEEQVQSGLSKALEKEHGRKDLDKKITKESHADFGKSTIWAQSQQKRRDAEIHRIRMMLTASPELLGTLTPKDRKLLGLSEELPDVAASKALGGFGGLSIVGERGGEVVASRSALRSGIGIGGRAASALAGIGVPGFYRGAAIEQTYATQGLAGAAGAQSFRSAGASAFQSEQKNQQRAMVDYWRREYDRQMKEASKGAAEERKKDSISWAKYAKGFFNAYPALIDKTLQKAFNVQSGVGKEMYKGVFTAMQAWSSGESPKKALMIGVKTALSESLDSGALGGFLDKLGEKNKVLADGLKGAVAMFAATGSLKKTGRALAGAGAKSLMTKYLGGDAMSMAKEYMGAQGGNIGGYMQQQELGARAEGFGGAATGKYVNSPTLMMVGEGGAGEVVIPTERIRKGLPINAGVASELGSIGVPGFANGGLMQFGAGPKRDYVGPGGVAPGPSALDRYGSGVKGRFGEMGGFGGIAKGGAAAGLMTGFDTFMQTGDWKQGATSGVGAAAGLGISAGLMALGVPPPFNTMIGGLAGPLIAKGLNKVFGVTGGQKKGRNRSLKLLESHIKSAGIFDFGQPSGLRKQMKRAIGGKENAPTEGNYNKLIDKIGGSRVLKPLWAGGLEPNMLVALGQGQLKGKQAFDAYAAMNTALYGAAGGDKYMQAMQVGPQLAEGGIVTRPTTAVIGERGPEIVIPLTEQRKKDKEMIDEMKKQNKLMMEMIKTQKETGKTEIRLDGRKISESVGENFYEIGSGM